MRNGLNFFFVGRTIVQSFLFIYFIFFNFTYSQTSQSEIGKFDIKKVQQAVQDQSDTSIGESIPIAAKTSENFILVILRITLYLAIVIVAIFAVAWIAKKIGISNSSKIGGGGAMDVLEILQFGQNRNAILVRVMDTVYLLGQTPTSIVLLEKIEGQKAIDLIASSKGGGTVMQFKDVFNNFLGKMKK